MDKRIIVGILIISFGVFVSAWEGEAEVTIEKGWNLVYGLGEINLLEGQLLGKSDVKKIYGFIPTTQEYVEIYPEIDFTRINLIDDDELLNTAFWVYSEKEVRTKYFIAEEITLLKDRPIYKGWNFVGITPEFAGKSLNQVKGNCNIQKAYAFEEGQWVNLVNNMDDAGMLGENSMQFKGVVIKVSNNCRFSSENSEDIEAPELP